jgi:hypothetical protein
VTRRERYAAAAARRDAEQLAALCALIAATDPTATASLGRAAVDKAAPGRGARTRLLAQLRGDPSLLTTGSSQATLAVCRLAAVLVEQGATAIVRPRCSSCGLAAELVKRAATGGICAACYNRARVADCGGCGQHRRIAGRAADGSPRCSSCRARDPDRHEPCSSCGQRRAVNRRDASGNALCSTCAQRAKPLERCDACGQPGSIAQRGARGTVCRRCYRPPRRRCGGCGRMRRIALATRDGRPDLCGTCHWAPTATCTRCATVGQCVGVRAGAPLCLRCVAADRVDELLTHDGVISEPMALLREAFLDCEQPRSIHTWLDHSPARHVARRLATGELALTHAALDELEQTPSLSHLRALLVAVGALPERDAHLARAEHAVARLLDQVGDDEQRRLLRAYATWRVLHRIRRRGRHHPASAFTAARARSQLATAAAFLGDHGGDLATTTQRQVDHWLAKRPARARSELRGFIDWAHTHGHAPALTVPRPPNSTSATAVDADARWRLARRLLHDEDLDPADRVAGILVVLYAQPVARIARLRASDVRLTDDRDTLLRLARDELLMPEPLGSLVRRLPHRRQHGASATLLEDPWLFPGRQAGQPQHPEHLRRRLQALSIDCRAQRNAALMQLAAEVPAAILADTLGITPRTAVRWAAEAGGNWTTYAARRTRA